MQFYQNPSFWRQAIIHTKPLKFHRSILRFSFHTLACLASLLFFSSSLPLPLLLPFFLLYGFSPNFRPNLVLNPNFIRLCLALKNPFLGEVSLFAFKPITLGHLYFNFLLLYFGLKSCQIMIFKPLFGQFTILSLNLVNFRVSRFRVSHLTHETVKLCLQNTLNMSKTTRVYFGMLHH